ncbi:T9SS type B sorting domain-containing protein [uncultured Kordia sp.]|uniref:lectin-like domain-containing protein n=2 Tax=uncultured Kordia sp. TaxID=507699 RepID=UPI00262449B1|nr:T9SS type B sorting domain-containing protein [uncultured Kordia sp.]
MILTKNSSRIKNIVQVFFILFCIQLNAQLMPSLIGDTVDIGGDCFEITQNVNSQSGAVWSGTPVDVTEDFVVEFRGFFGTNDANGADGITFILKNTQTPEIGNLGGGMGYEGIGNSLAVEFDTWQNNELSDPFFDHLAIVSQGNNNHTGATNLAGPVQASPTSTNIEDGVEHIIRIEWTAATTTLEVYFDCSLRLSYTGDIINNLFNGVTQAYFGFTGSTGGATNLQRVCFDYVSFANSLAFGDEIICGGQSLSSVDATVTGATSYSWTPTAGVSDPALPNPVFTPTMTTTYTVEISNSCADIIQESFTITVEPSPTADSVADITVCDDNSNDGVEEFDFTTLDATILGTQDPTMFTVTYHSSQADADNNANALTFPYTNTNQCEDIFARVGNNLGATCYSVTSFEICVDEQPVANQPSDMNACDPDANGSEVYDFTMQEAAILGTQNAADVNITFHANATDANNDMNPLPTSYTGTDGETIFVRVDSNTAGNDCFSITSFQLFLDAFPTANPVADIAVCDDDTNDDIEEFDFSTLDATVLGAQNAASYTVTYHTSQADADNDMNALTFPYSNTNQCEQIFVRLENNSNSVCFDTTSFEICVNTQPIANQPNDMRACDFDANGMEMYDFSTQEAAILGTQNAADVNITFHADAADATNGMNPLPANYTGSNGETIFVRVESTEAGNVCIAVTSFQLIVDTVPIANVAADIAVCDDNSNDGVENFNFTNLNTTILGTQDPTMFTVTYHSSQADADNDMNALTFPFVNTAPCQQIYVRIENNMNTMCYSTTDFEICVYEQPIANQPDDMITCDLNSDGVEDYDLTTQEAAILGGQNPANFNISFHNNQMDADNDVNPLPSIYFGADGETIIVRIESTQAGNDCYATTSFNLLFEELPSANAPTDLIVCDDETADGFTAIDLNVKNDEISGGIPGLSVRYYLNQMDAENDTNSLAIPYTNISNPQTVFVRVETANTGCYVITTLTVSVVDAPQVFPATPLEYCDTDNDGFGIFDIRSTENQITGGMLTNVSVTYHETPEDADNNVNTLADTYSNINPYNQTIYVRVENVLTGCFNVVSLDLIVHDSPEIAALDATSLAECDDVTADQIAQFDLTEAEMDILNGEDPTTHTVRYYNTQANAVVGTTVGEINNPNAYSNIPPSPQVIWVRVEDQVTGCFSITNLTLIVNELPVLIQLPGLELCDAITLDDQIEVFDLTSLAEDLVNNVPGISLIYYGSAADLASDTPILNPSAYPNAMVAVQTIFVLATNDTTGCQNTITFDIRVNPLPSPTLDPNGLLLADTCDDDNDGFVGTDLDALVTAIVNMEPDVVYSFHETEAEAIANLNALASPYTNIVMDSQTLYVLATNTVTGCFTVTPLQINVIAIPEVPINITDLEVCDEDPSDGFAMFDLTQTQMEIYGTQTPGALTLTYHESEQDAIDDVSPIVNLTDYINITINQQTIWVRLEDNATECYAIGNFDIIVVDAPKLVQPTPFSLCDDLESGSESDEISSFDLTDRYLEIVDGDNGLTLTYYASLADLNADTPIADPTAYQNISNPQVLYIRAANAAGCTTDITMTLRVLPIPTPNTMPAILEACDDDSDGDATNGILIFDLTQSEAEIVNNESNVTVSYHTTQEDADNDTNPIADPTMHAVDMATADVNGQVIIYVRVESDIQIDSNMLPCYKVVELPVIVHPLPELTATAFTYVFCEYDNDNVGQFEWDVVTASLDLLTAPQMVADFTVTYHLTVAEALAGTGALVNGFENMSDPQTIFIRVENTATGCVNTNNIASLELSVEPIPTATAPDTYQLCAVDEADQDTAVFDLTTLDADIINGQLNMAVSYYETATDADADINAIANTTSYTNTSNPQTLYARVRQTITGCLSDPVLVNLQVNPLPVFTLPADDILCVDAATGTTQDGPFIGEDQGAGFTYLWNTPNGIFNTATVQVTTAGTYSLVITDGNFPTNCSYSDSVTYEASSAPASLDVQITTPAFADTHNVIATATGGSGVYEYQLDDGEWQDTGEFLDLQPGEHTVTVRDTNGCGELVRTFELIDYMKFFTPNGDEYHPTWNIIGLRNQPSAKIYIFDRYGKLLKQISPAGIGWDGTFNGSPMPSQDYWFRVEYVDPFDGSPKEFINHFTLKR